MLEILFVIGNCSWISISVEFISPQHPIYTIPNPIDTNFWEPVDSALARSLFNLPTNSHLVLFSSLGTLTDSRKGLDLLLTAIALLPSSINRQNVEFVLLGSCSNTLLKTLSNLGINFTSLVVYLIFLKILYSAVDLWPSLLVKKLSPMLVLTEVVNLLLLFALLVCLILSTSRTGYLAGFLPSDFADVSLNSFK